jgi:hypothetical protein
MTILLNDILTLTAPEEYKLHLACQNKVGVHPLDEFVGHPDDDNSTGLTFQPGVDVRVLADAIDLLRPTGAVGLTSDSPDGGVGGSVVLAWDPSR